MIRPIHLLSIAGDLLPKDFKQSLTHVHHRSEEYVFLTVMKYLKSVTLRRQTRYLEAIAEYLEIDLSKQPLMITRITDENAMISLRRNNIKRRFKDITYVNNKQSPSKIDITDLPRPNLEVVMKCINRKDPTMKLVCFEKEIPSELSDLVVSSEGLIQKLPIPSDLEITWENSYREMMFGSSLF